MRNTALKLIEKNTNLVYRANYECWKITVKGVKKDLYILAEKGNILDIFALARWRKKDLMVVDTKKDKLFFGRKTFLKSTEKQQFTLSQKFASFWINGLWQTR